MNEIRRELPELPERMKALPVDHRGYPVPWFVAFIDGKPDFRVIRMNGVMDAYNNHRCWVCGQRRGAVGAFVIGPMCAVNRVAPEPPSHLECAQFSARACPFLSRPKMKRNEVGMPEIGSDAPGIPIKRNPGVSLVYTSRTWVPFEVPNGFLFDVGEPINVWWWAEGRSATRAQVMESIDSGFPILEEMAKKDGPAAVAQLARYLDRAMKLVPLA